VVDALTSSLEEPEEEVVIFNKKFTFVKGIVFSFFTPSIG